LSLSGLSGQSLPVVNGIVAGLVLGKPLGLMLTSFLVVRSGLSDLPEGVTWRHLSGASVLCGIGFTMSLFVASLGFGSGVLLEAAKVGILLASLVAGVVGYLVLRSVPPQVARTS
jgi:NhaA family Na+:H+ antiporter